MSVMKKKKIVEKISKILLASFVLFASGFFAFPLQSNSAWYDTTWTKRIRLSTNPAAIPSTQTDFVAYIDLSLLPSSFFTDVNADGSDIVITADDEVTQLDHELVSLNTTSETGELHVNIPSVSGSSATDIFLYYGNTSAVNTSTPNTWSDYRAVWHLDEPAATTSSSGIGVVSQSGMDGVNGGWAVLYGPNPVTDTQINTAIDEDIINDTERAHTSEQLFYWAFNTSTAIDILDDSSSIIGEVAIVSSVGSTTSTYTFRNTYTNPVIVASNVLVSDSDTPVVVRIDSLSTTQAQLFLQSPGGVGTPTVADVHVIIMEDGAHTLPGGISVEAGSVNVTGVNEDGNWNSSEMVKLSPTNSYGTPVVLGQVMTTNDPLWSVFWSSNGSQQNPANSSNIYVGRNVAEDTVVARAAEDIGYIILEAGTGFIGSTSWAADLSTDSVSGVGDSPPYSFSLGGGALSGAFSDSTINQFNTNFTGTVTGQNAGAIGNAVFTSGSTESRLPIGGLVYTNKNNLTELTASLWLRTTDTARSGILDFDRSEHWQIGMNFHNAGGDNGKISFDTANSADGIEDLNSATTVNDDSWHFVTVVYDNADANDKKIYIDGVLSSQADQHTTGLGKGTTRYGFMADGSEASTFNGGNNNLLYEGYLDEVRISHTAKSADRILAEYNNQSDNASFWAVSLSEDVNTAPTAATNLFFDHTSAQTGDSNPIDVTIYGTSSRTPHFSAIYTDPDSGDIANMARIQVSTDPTFASITHWDSGWASISNVTEGNRSSDIEYDNFGDTATLALAMDDGNVTYYWRIAFEDDGGEEGPFSSPASFSLLDIPNQPMGLAAIKVSGTPDTFTLNWSDTSTNEDTFELERRDNTGGGFGSYIAILGSPFVANTTAINDTTTVNNAEYQYRIRACNYAGCSDPYEADPFSHFTEPEAPDDVTADYVSDTEFTVNFIDRSILNAVTIDRCNGLTACQADVFGTNIVTQSASVQDASENRTDTTSIAVDEVYRWRVRADDGGTTSQYTYSGFEFTRPDAPSGVSAIYQTDSAILVSWTDESQYESGFRLSVSVNGGGFTEITPGVNTVGAGITSYLYTSAIANNSYQFRVVAQIGATSQNGELFSTNADSGTAKTTPSQPSDTTATYVADNDIQINWTDNASNEDQYEILVSENGGGFTSAAIIAADSTNYSYTAATADNYYEFIVRAGVTISAPENPNALDADSAVTSPRINTTPATPVIAAGSIGPSTINWEFTDNSTNEEGVIVFESDGSTEVKTLAVPNVTAWTEVGLNPNTQYTRTIRAYVLNEGVVYPSSASASASIYTLANAPGNVLVEASGGSLTVDVTWETNSNPVGTEFRAVNTNTAEDSGWTTATSWQNTNLDCGQTYSFVVSSRNADGVENPAETVEYTPVCGNALTFFNNTVPTNIHVELEGGAPCSIDNKIDVEIHSDNAYEYRISTDASFTDRNWFSFTTGGIYSVQTESKSGVYAIYVQVRSRYGFESAIIRDVIEVDLDFGCVGLNEEDPQEALPEVSEDLIDDSANQQENILDTDQVVSLDYQVDLINPDKTRREMGSPYAQVQLLESHVERIFFEDSGSDMDFNDVVVQVLKSVHSEYGDIYEIEIVLLDAAWHHEVIFLYNGVEHIAFHDSQSASFTALFDISDNRFVHELPEPILVRSINFEEVYLVENGERRVFVNPLSLFSHGYRFDQVQVWQEERFSSYGLVGVILPKAQTVLIKSPEDSRVYYLEENTESIYIPIAREILSEDQAQGLFSERWRDFVVDMDSSLFTHFPIGSSLEEGVDYFFEYFQI